MIRQHRDKDGHHWTVPRDGETHPRVELWWSRDPKVRKLGRTTQEEWLVLRQDDGEKADVILLSLGQAYDLMKALANAVEKP